MASFAIAEVYARFFGSRKKLEGRELHRAVAVRDSLYLWGGKIAGTSSATDDELRKLFYHVQHFRISTREWATRITTGNPPMGFLGYSCCAIADKLYFFGGSLARASVNEFYNSIDMLDTGTSDLKWSNLQRNRPDLPVMGRALGGMIPFKCNNGDQHLLIIGGIGSEPKVRIPTARYCVSYVDEKDGANTLFCTNENSIYNISSEHWCDPPDIIGECMAPARGFVMEELSHNSAIIFGGSARAEDVRDDIYLLEISVKKILWQCLKKAGPSHQWPVKRYLTGAATITSIGDPILVITGGADENFELLNDCWLFNTKKTTWIKVTNVPQAFSERMDSSLSAFVMSPHCVWLVTTGGNYTTNSSEMMIIELVNDNDQWKVGSTLDSTDKMYQSLYKSFQLLQISEKQQEIQRVTEDFRQRQEEKEREVHRYRQQLQQMEGELEANKEAWVIDMNEVIITEEELGKGSYGSVNVGIFRGLKVAVKSLHDIIISDYNLDGFTREMNIASQIRHPNLVQFLGATAKNTASPLILTELMATSLHSVLQKTNVQMEKQQIFNISQDIALGLNYLHLFKPQPIVHRDISSPNILLKPCIGPAGYEAKVADYGTAKTLHSISSGTIMPGNPAYAAPEARDPDKHSPAMDVYSYSVLLMEMSLCKAPKLTVAERKKQATKISSESLKNLVERGLSESENRPTMSMVLKILAEL